MKYLPIVIYTSYWFYLIAILGDLDWYVKNVDNIEKIDFVLCFIMLIHALFRFSKYPTASKSSFFTIIALALFHVFYYNFEVSNTVYYFVYTSILALNLIYIILADEFFCR